LKLYKNDLYMDEIFHKKVSSLLSKKVERPWLGTQLEGEIDSTRGLSNRAGYAKQIL